MTNYAEFHRRSIEDRDAFWRERGRAHRLADAVRRRCSTTRGRRSRRWFVGGRTNLCHNAVDRHLAAARRAAGARSTSPPRPTGRRSTPIAQLHDEVNRCRGDAEGERRGPRRSRADLHADDRRGGVRDARLRAHRRRFIRSCSAASRRRASPRASTMRGPKLMVTADAGMRGGKVDPVQAAGRRSAAARARIRRGA